MKQLTLQGLKFIAVTAVLYLLYVFALTRVSISGRPLVFRTSDYYQWKGGVAYSKFQEWDPQAEWDAIVIGSSHAYRGYDPRVFAEHGYRMFNLGSSGQTPLSTYAVLDEYVPRERTGLVIIDLYEGAFTQDGLESVSDLTQNMSSDAAALKLATSFHDLRALNMFTLRMMNRNGPPLYADPDYITAGFAVAQDSLHTPQNYDQGLALDLNERQLEYLTRCLDLCAERGLRVVLTTHFYPHGSDRTRHAAFVRSIQSLIHRHTSTGRGKVEWLDLAFDHSADDMDHFSDHNHLNAAGARIFNELLIDTLVARGYLPRR